MNDYKALRKACIEHDITPSDLAIRVGMSKAAMSNVLTGKRPFKLCEIKKIVECLNLEADRIPEYFF